ncbi:ATP-dependent DNA helicase [Salinigranum marinum]|uniref:ATP-dependent DNA helicase n=1 Tax=Salinigranum marinum TaxID=1515595 RepID=UPI002989CBAA|nr:ATP-dependent DNA helicase [Salinigranum marinum]
MTEPHPRPGPETPPGDLDAEEFLEIVEAVRRAQTGNPDWSFDDDQRAAILNAGGPYHLTAGPGSGKSTVTVTTAAKGLLVDGIPPGAIIVTTYTKKAAKALEQRLEALLTALGYADVLSVDEMYVGTGHRLWGDIMREFRYEDYQNVELLDADAQAMFIARHSEYVDVLADGDAGTFAGTIRGLNDDGTCSKGTAATLAKKLFNRISQLRVDVDALAASDRPEFQRLAEGYRAYLETLRDESRCDFARLQERFLEFLETEAGRRFVGGDPDRDHPPLQCIAVDEYQDANPLQEAIYFRLAELMADEEPTLMVVGDDDQALYRFRGGTVDCLIEFPERIADYLGIDVERVETAQLHWNYRSRPEIVAWANRHIGEHPVMTAPGARAPGKRPMEAFRSPVDHSSVHLLKEDTKAEAATAFAAQVEDAYTSGYIQDFSQVALLAHSTREYWPYYESRTFVGECVRALEARGIPVHNPRNKGFLQQEEIQAMLAALARCLDPELQWADDSVFPYDGVGNKLPEWCDTLDRVIDRHDATELEAYIEEVARRVADTPDGEVVNLSLVDLYNRLRSHKPFSTWTETDPDVDRTKRLGKLSQLTESFEGIARGLTQNRQLTRTPHDDYDTVSVGFLSDFYWTFCRYLDTVALDDPEDPHDALPDGHVQVMTVHQAKGLEFPVVFVASLGRLPDDTFDRDDDGDPLPKIADVFSPFTERTPPVDVPTRAERDLIRQFYVAHSRAKDNLVLLGANYYLRPADGRTVVPSLGADAGIPLEESWFSDDQRLDRGTSLAPAGATVGPVTDDDVRRTYSIVGDGLSFNRCKRQYGMLQEHGFAAGSGTQLFAGMAVHQTLDWAHRYYNGDVDGVAGGSPPSTKALREEFDSVVEALRDQRIMPMGSRAVDAVFEHVARFNRTIGPDLYPKVVDTECKLRRNAGAFLLTGVADVITDDDGRTKLCDYKASQRPEPGDGYLADYREQLLVYAGLYAEKEGELPDSALLYFLGEDDPEDTCLELDFTSAEVEDAIDHFEATIHDLEHARRTNSWSEMEDEDLPDEATCAECDFRWDCPYRDYDDR